MDQENVADYLLVDRSTVSRIESGVIRTTAEIEREYVAACGGANILRTLIDHLQSLLERLGDYPHRLIPA